MDANTIIEENDLFVRRRGNGIARINFTSIDGSVNYRLVGSRRTYHVKRESFLRNWTPLQTKPHKKEHSNDKPDC